MTEISKTFTFDAAHRLPKLPSGHKCSRPHGHTYAVTLFFRGEPDERGFVIDYADIATSFEPILRELDHRCLNDVWGLENPTTEVLARWVWIRVKAILPALSAVEVKESSTTACRYWESAEPKAVRYGHLDGHVDCPCWVTGEFRWVDGCHVHPYAAT